jgi:hypothetical protein
MENQQRETERQAHIDAEATAVTENAFFDANPDLLQYFKNSENNIIQTRDKLQKAAEGFYDLDDDQIATYTTNKHRPEHNGQQWI